jgi:hypothetical protein
MAKKAFISLISTFFYYAASDAVLQFRGEFEEVEALSGRREQFLRR